MEINLLPKSEFPHNERILSENEYLNYNPLPSTIKKRINGFNLAYIKYSQATTQEKADITLNKLKATSFEIADMIQDWVEKDLPEADIEKDTEGVQFINGKPATQAEIEAENKRIAAENANQNKDDDDSNKSGGFGIGSLLLTIGLGALGLSLLKFRKK